MKDSESFLEGDPYGSGNESLIRAAQYESDAMKLVTSNQMRELDAAAIASGISGDALMQTAGEGLAAAIRRLEELHQLVDAPVLFVAG